MSFQDNSGDIILDAVLTNLGRKYLARGDGSFRITKFALGDDEVNYGLYNSDAEASLKDLKLLQVPVFEASTNESTALRYKAISLSSNNNLYLPVARVNTKAKGNGLFDGFPFAATSVNAGTQNQYVVLANQSAVDQYTGDNVPAADKGIPDGFINGVNAAKAAPFVIRVEQGFDSQIDDVEQEINPELIEDQFSIQMDDRLLKLVSPQGKLYTESFIDSDNIATYIVPRFVSNALGAGIDTGFYVDGRKTSDDAGLGSILGSTSLQTRFSLVASNSVQGDSKLYTTLGVTRTSYFAPTSQNAQTIDTVVRLIGNKTGIRLDIPVRIARKTT